MGNAAGHRLIAPKPSAAVLVAGLLGSASLALSEPIHFDGVDGPPAWAGRVEVAIRDSLLRRNADLWPLDSLEWLKARNEWNGSQRDPQKIAVLAKRTKRTTVAWVKSAAPVATFDRPWWSLLWTRRIWTLQADIYLADATGQPKTSRLSLEKKVWLGFTGTNGADLWPVTEPERSRAEAELLAELAGLAARNISESGATKEP